MLGPSCYRIAIVFLAILALVPVTMHAGLSHDPKLHWRTLQGGHFLVHFHDGEEALAQRTLAIAERIHRQLAPKVGWEPAAPTEIILTDESDLSNGWATLVPANRMTIFTAAPDGIYGLEDNAGWLELVITHEYLHILHLDMARGVWSVLRRIFGRSELLFPSAYQPMWLIEGLATHVETDRERGIGRGQSSYYDMLMRAEVDRGLRPLRQVNQPQATWPSGHTSYLYGVHFYQYLVDALDETAPFGIAGGYSNTFPPFLIGTNARRTTGLKYRYHWPRFEEYLDGKFGSQIESVRSRGERAGERLTNDGFLAGPLRALEDGRLFYVGFDGTHRSHLTMIDAGGQRRRLRKIPTYTRLDVHPDAGVLLARPQYCRNAVLNYDLYRTDLKGRKHRRLTRCGRYRSASWSPDGDRIAAIRNSLNSNELHILDAEGRLLEKLWTGSDYELVTDLDWSPDGGRLAAAVWRSDGRWDLELFDIASRTWTSLTDDDAIEGEPQFTSDGTAVLFTTDSDGIYNVMRMDLGRREVRQLTDVTGGAFWPAPAGDGRDLYYVGYDASGFDLYHLTTEPEAPVVRKPFEPAESAISASPEAPEPGTETTVSRYRPWRGLRPRSWLPLFFVDEARIEIGAATYGWDALQRHQYAVGAAWDFENEWLVGYADYVYDRWLPVLHFSLSRGTDAWLDSDNDPLLVRSDETALGEIVFPLRRYFRTGSIHLGAAFERAKDIWRREDIPPVEEEQDSVAGVGVVFDSTGFQPLNVSRADGREITVVAESSDAFGGDFTGQVYRLDYREFVRLRGEHVLALRLAGGWGTESPRSFRLGGEDEEFGVGSSILGSPGEVLFGRRDFPLRGYREGSGALTGRRMALGSLEYRFPIRRLERGLWGAPVGIHQLHGSVFADAGDAWDVGDEPEDVLVGAGVEFHTEFILGYGMWLPITLGYAHGFDGTEGDDRFYLRFGASF